MCFFFFFSFLRECKRNQVKIPIILPFRSDNEDVLTDLFPYSGELKWHYRTNERGNNQRRKIYSCEERELIPGQYYVNIQDCQNAIMFSLQSANITTAPHSTTWLYLYTFSAYKCTLRHFELSDKMSTSNVMNAMQCELTRYDVIQADCFATN